MKLSQQNTEKEEFFFYDDEQEEKEYDEMLNGHAKWSDIATRIIKIVIGILLLIFSIVWSYKAW